MNIIELCQGDQIASLWLQELRKRLLLKSSNDMAEPLLLFVGGVWCHLFGCRFVLDMDTPDLPAMMA